LARRLTNRKTNHSRARHKRAFRGAELVGAGLEVGGEYTCPKQQAGRGRDVMKFGIFYELQLPRPWQAGGELKLYQDTR
jgi:hypothetical protein